MIFPMVNMDFSFIKFFIFLFAFFIFIYSLHGTKKRLVEISKYLWYFAYND